MASNLPPCCSSRGESKSRGTNDTRTACSLVPLPSAWCCWHCWWGWCCPTPVADAAVVRALQLSAEPATLPPPPPQYLTPPPAVAAVVVVMDESANEAASAEEQLDWKNRIMFLIPPVPPPPPAPGPPPMLIRMLPGVLCRLATALRLGSSIDIDILVILVILVCDISMSLALVGMVAESTTIIISSVAATESLLSNAAGVRRETLGGLASAVDVDVDWE
mmetsp:Transcript_8683/g.18306  ORF Transcript_8683/g.18306 Transcript_8683/m.18306 type:complete len:220 (-) Transcript_8683:919-1578(-)